MSQPLTAAVGALRQASESLADAAAGLVDLDPGAGAFGTDGPGVLGELGRDLHAQCVAALVARGREAAAHQAHLDEAAEIVRRAASSYATADDGPRRRAQEVG
jgi:hypothetical protein